MLFRQYDLNQTSKVEVDFGSNTERQYWSGRSNCTARVGWGKGGFGFKNHSGRSHLISPSLLQENAMLLHRKRNCLLLVLASLSAWAQAQDGEDVGRLPLNAIPRNNSRPPEASQNLTDMAMQ